jgi:predicted aconitase
VRVALERPPRSRADFGALGHHVGRLVQDGVPYFQGVEAAGLDELKLLGAAMAASGAVAMYHVEGLTPEAALHDPAGLETLRVTPGDLELTVARLNTGQRPDLVVVGCPHASLEELEQVDALLRGRQVRRPLWVCTSRQVREQAAELGLLERLERAGAQVVADTCMVVAPIEQMGVRTTAVDSGKAAHYLPGFCGQRVLFGDLERLVREALS